MSKKEVMFGLDTAGGSCFCGGEDMPESTRGIVLKVLDINADDPFAVVGMAVPTHMREWDGIHIGVREGMYWAFGVSNWGKIYASDLEPYSAYGCPCVIDSERKSPHEFEAGDTLYLEWKASIEDEGMMKGMKKTKMVAMGQDGMSREVGTLSVFVANGSEWSELATFEDTVTPDFQFVVGGAGGTAFEIIDSVDTADSRPDPPPQEVEVLETVVEVREEKV